MAIESDIVTASACLVADGGWGTEFQKRGLEPGASPEHWNLVHPDQVAEVARSYVVELVPVHREILAATRAGLGGREVRAVQLDTPFGFHGSEPWNRWNR